MPDRQYPGWRACGTRRSQKIKKRSKHAVVQLGQLLEQYLLILLFHAIKIKKDKLARGYRRAFQFLKNRPVPENVKNLVTSPTRQEKYTALTL